MLSPKNMSNRIYICDDEEGMLLYLQKTIAEWGFEVEPHASPLTLLTSLEQSEHAGGVLLLDIRMSDMDGMSVLQQAKSLRPEMGVIMMTGYGTIDSAVDAIKLGAFDYLTKPFPEDRLKTALRRCLEREILLAENLSLKRDLQSRIAPGSIIFQSRSFQEVYKIALRVAESDVNVLLLGESGTGKELVAGAIHYASPLSDKRFLALNCAALTESLLESQLFGHVKGAFTGAVQAQKGLLEEADGGTLFLDEVGDLSPALQVKLLRVLEEGEFIPVGAVRAKRVDVRFIAATNKDVEREVVEGRFREDLYYRLNVISLQLPPLRERPEDIEPLAGHFLSQGLGKLGRNVREIAPEALTALRAYHWPGNVRELRNVIERGAILAGGEQITVDDLPLKMHRQSADPAAGETNEPLTLRDAERLQVERILHRTGGNKSQAARTLDITRPTLDRKIEEYGLHPSTNNRNRTGAP
jgi:two-component system response regulator HydG